MTGYKEGFEKLREKLDAIEAEAIKKMERKLVEIASEVVATATRLTPTGKSKRQKGKSVSYEKNGETVSYKRKDSYTGGLLKKSWAMSKIKNRNSGGNIARGIIISNNAHYAVHVEYGHRTRLGSSKNPKYKSKGTIYYIKGRFMLREALKRVGIHSNG